jgi:archaellin
MREDTGAVGLGTAGLTAASVAALLVVSGPMLGKDGMLGAAEDLQKQASELARSTTEGLTPSLQVVGVVGKVQGEGPIDGLNVTLRPAAAGDVGLEGLLLRLADKDRERWLGFAPHPGQGSFGVAVLRDIDGSWARDKLLTKGDLVSLDLDLRPGASDFGLAPRTAFRLEVLPAEGAPEGLGLETPLTYGTGRVFTLH